MRARNLIAADANGKSDPYCRVCIGQKIFNTSVQPNTLNPEWQQSIAFINEHLSPFALLQGKENVIMCLICTVHNIYIYITSIYYLLKL